MGIKLTSYSYARRPHVLLRFSSFPLILLARLFVTLSFECNAPRIGFNDAHSFTSLVDKKRNSYFSLSAHKSRINPNMKHNTILINQTFARYWVFHRSKCDLVNRVTCTFFFNFSASLWKYERHVILDNTSWWRACFFFALWFVLSLVSLPCHL